MAIFQVCVRKGSFLYLYWVGHAPVSTSVLLKLHKPRPRLTIAQVVGKWHGKWWDPRRRLGQWTSGMPAERQRLSTSSLAHSMFIFSFFLRFGLGLCLLGLVVVPKPRLVHPWVLDMHLHRLEVGWRASWWYRCAGQVAIVAIWHPMSTITHYIMPPCPLNK